MATRILSEEKRVDCTILYSRDSNWNNDNIYEQKTYYGYLHSTIHDGRGTKQSGSCEKEPWTKWKTSVKSYTSNFTTIIHPSKPVWTRAPPSIYMHFRSSRRWCYRCIIGCRNSFQGCIKIFVIVVMSLLWYRKTVVDQLAPSFKTYLY